MGVAATHLVLELSLLLVLPSWQARILQVPNLLIPSFSCPRCQPKQSLDEKQLLFLVPVLARNGKEPAG